MDIKEEAQYNMYQFPYHYIPSRLPKYRLHRKWIFSASYLAAIELIEDWLGRVSKVSDGKSEWQHLDVGCGDGALINHLTYSAALPENITFTGIDHDTRAVTWAKMLNEEGEFYSCDIKDIGGKGFDSASLIEVLEHIKPSDVPDFIIRLADCLKPNAQVIVSVPSINKSLEKKHYQHFHEHLVRDSFSAAFEVRKLFGFERMSILNKAVMWTMYRSPIKVDADFLTEYIVKSFKKECSLGRCGRIMAILERK